jgi:hypothetical protein
MTPVDVSLCVSAYTSTPASARASGAVPGSVLMTDGSPRKGAALVAAANFDENSPNTRCCERSRTRLSVAMSQKAVAPPLPRTTS